MPDVLILCEYATLNGGEQSMLATLDGVRRSGFRVAVVAPPAGPLADTLAAREVEVAPFSMEGDDGARLVQDQLRRRLGDILRRRRPDLIHANSLSMGRLVGPVAAELGISSLAHLRDIVGLSAAAISDLNCHTRLLAVSNATRDYHVAAGLDAGKTFVLYNGVDLQRFRPRAPTGYLHRELGLPAEAQLVGTIGQIILRKGLDVLFEAARSVITACEQAHFLIVGERYSRKDEARRFEADLRQAVQQEPLGGHVHFLGWRDDVPELLSELTILVHAARQEPLGRVLLEAAAVGVPVVATDVGGTAEIFPPKLSAALLVPADDAAGLAEAVVRLLDDPHERDRLAQSARRRAEDAFDARTAADALAAHYGELLS